MTTTILTDKNLQNIKHFGHS